MKPAKAKPAKAKPAKASVAVVVTNPAGEFLVTRRPDDPADPLAGVWGLPALTRAAGESGPDAARRIGPVKIGVTLLVGAEIGALSADRGEYVLHLTDYAATITAGTPSVPQADDSVTQYVACRFTADPGVLIPAARRGSLCCRILLDSLRHAWA